MTILGLVITLVTAAAVGEPAVATRIELSPVARDVDEGPVVLGEIATISGPDAARFATIVVAPSREALPRPTPNWASISAATARAAIEKQPWVNLGRVELIGASVDIALPRIERSIPAPKPIVEPAPPIEYVPAPADTVAGVIEATLRSFLDVDAHNLRVLYEERDQTFLDASTSGRVVSARPTALGERTPVDVTIYEGERLVERRSVRTMVSVRRRASVTRRALLRDDLITAEDVDTSERWMSPSIHPADEADVVGSVAGEKLGAATVVERGDVAPPMVIKRGDLVDVHCVSGPFVLKRKARALSDAREGELLILESIGERTRLHARAAAPGVAVMDASAP